MKVIISGITNQEDAQNAIFLGADAISFIFDPQDKNFIPVHKAEEITAFLPPFITLIGIFQDQAKKEIENIIQRCHLNIAEYRGQETAVFCLETSRKIIRSLPASDAENIPLITKYQGVAAALKLRAPAAAENAFDWGVAIKAKKYYIPLILSENINSTNLKKISQIVKPYAVDFSTNIEKEVGKKDYNKMQEVLTVAKSI